VDNYSKVFFSARERLATREKKTRARGTYAAGEGDIHLIHVESEGF
jgi:hypothetical protein